MNLLDTRFETPYNTAPFSQLDVDAFLPAFKKAIESAKAEINLIVKNKALPSFENTIEALERSGAELDRVFSYYGIMSSNVSSAEFREIQSNLAPKLSVFSSTISQNKALFDRIDVNIDPTLDLAELSVSQRQMVEIAKAISYEAKVIVLDEPTSSLTETEVKVLFRILKSLKEQGIGVIYISHKMEEIFEITDEVTVLRDGNYIGTEHTKDLNMDKIINMMVGRNLENRFPSKEHKVGKVLLEAKGFSTMYEPQIHDVSFTLKKGEILGVSGLVGAGRTEMAEAIFGARTITSGELFLDGKKINNKNTIKAIENGFALITEERRVTGIYPMSDINFNSTIANIEEYANMLGLINEKQMFDDTEKQIKNMRIKTPTQKELIRNLSGGNQQKVIIGRWLLLNPNILIMDEPTRGIDVGAKYEIYQLMLDLVATGKSIIMISSEMPELIGITDRIMVMSNGRVAGIVETKNTNQAELFTLATKHL